MAKVHITDTILRDAHQSLIATRMRTEDMLPICDKLDKVGEDGVRKMLVEAGLSESAADACVAPGASRRIDPCPPQI